MTSLTYVYVYTRGNCLNQNFRFFFPSLFWYSLICSICDFDRCLSTHTFCLDYTKSLPSRFSAWTICFSQFEYTRLDSNPKFQESCRMGIGLQLARSNEQTDLIKPKTNARTRLRSTKSRFSHQIAYAYLTLSTHTLRKQHHTNLSPERPSSPNQHHHHNYQHQPLPTPPTKQTKIKPSLRTHPLPLPHPRNTPQPAHPRGNKLLSHGLQFPPMQLQIINSPNAAKSQPGEPAAAPVHEGATDAAEGGCHGVPRGDG